MKPKVRWHRGKWWPMIEWQTKDWDGPTWTERNCLGGYATMGEALDRLRVHDEQKAEAYGRGGVAKA